MFHLLPFNLERPVLDPGLRNIESGHP
jgi:hypothetical protein